MNELILKSFPCEKKQLLRNLIEDFSRIQDWKGGILTFTDYPERL